MELKFIQTNLYGANSECVLDIPVEQCIIAKWGQLSEQQQFFVIEMDGNELLSKRIKGFNRSRDLILMGKSFLLMSNIEPIEWNVNIITIDELNLKFESFFKNIYRYEYRLFGPNVELKEVDGVKMLDIFGNDEFNCEKKITSCSQLIGFGKDFYNFGLKIRNILVRSIFQFDEVNFYPALLVKEIPSHKFDPLFDSLFDYVITNDSELYNSEFKKFVENFIN